MNKTLPFSMRLDADMKAELQKLADADNRSLTNFIETELRRIIAERRPPKRK
jgi:predicted transcriptional regulator